MAEKTITRFPATTGFDLVQITGSFDAGIAGLAEESVSLWDAEGLASLRVLLGVGHSVSTNGSWVRQGFVYVPDSEADILVVGGEHNPLVNDAVVATQAHGRKMEVYLTSDVLGALRARAETDVDRARMSGVYRLQRKDVKGEVPVGALGEYGLTRLLFGEQARPYSEFLRASGIENVPFIVASADYARNPKREGRAFARSLGVYCVDSGSMLNGFDDLCGDGGHVGGIRRYAREAGRAASSSRK